MLARVFEITVKPGVDPYQDGPALEAVKKNEADYTVHPGFIRLVEMFDRATGKLLQVSFWENEEVIESYLAKPETKEFYATMAALTHNLTETEPEISHFQVTKEVFSKRPALTQS